MAPKTLALDGSDALKARGSVDPWVACEHAEECGGCPLIGLPYPEQLAAKRGRVVDAIARYPLLELVYTDPVDGAGDRTVGYRARAKLMVAPGARLGLFARGGGHRVVDIPGCRVLSPVLARLAAVLRAELASAEAENGPLAPYDRDGTGALRAVDLREAQSEAGSRVLVTWVVDPSRPVSTETLRPLAEKLLASVPEIAGIALNVHDPELPQVLGSETRLVAGEATVSDRIGASVHYATFGSFVQAHRDQAAHVHRFVVAALLIENAPPKTLRVLDLYGGSGAIAMALASAGANVVMVESFGPAVQQARAAAAAQSLPVVAEQQDVGAALRRLCERGARFDAAVLNPPRRGTSPAAREWLARLAPSAIAYVSCDPETLARDLDHFARLGYRATSLRPVDMIPLTDEVEVVTLLRPAPRPAPRVLFENAEILVVDKAAHEPTMPQGEYGSSLLSRARQLPGAGHAVAVHRLEVGTSGVVVLAKTAGSVAKWASILTAPGTRMIYLALCRGILPAKGTATRDLRDEGKLYKARTRYRRLSVAAGQSMVRVVPDQARLHQIRRHMAAIGHPVLGDDRYGHAPSNRHFEEKYGLDRLFLHAVRLELDDPTNGSRQVIESPLPGDLRAVLDRTGDGEVLRWLDQRNPPGLSPLSRVSITPVPAEDDALGRPLDLETHGDSLQPGSEDDE